MRPTRRQILRAGLAVGAATLLGSAAGVAAVPAAGQAAARARPRVLAAAIETPTPRIFVKDQGPLLQLYPIVLGTRWDQQTTFITPIEQTFVRNRFATPVVDPAT